MIINNTELHYKTIGQGEPLLFIHGLGSSSRDWKEQVNHFSKSYRVITLDIRGHGKSSKTDEEYTISLFADDTIALLDALKISSAHIVGISMGGMIAFELAVSYPNRIRTLTIVNSTPSAVPQTIRERLQMWQRKLMVRLFSMKAIGEILGKRLFPNHKELKKLFAKRWAENDLTSYRKSVKAIFEWSVADQLDQIQAPTLLLSSEYDYIPLSKKEELVKQIANCKLVVIKDTHHALPVEKPDNFNEVLGLFLATYQKEPTPSHS
ncbi:alpha/beta hydrolase [Sulfurovum sp. bin170]|uniref:alpha/beta fold hydrolase n=1 Tax=Sulfurovum sp. bin170 TaxID=2695268 RepID=UPI0013E02091|nr:alpha/beta hydrolase [Sulfurovum sp. bin170]NEW60948.1 alpha/beta hydrolase [Sulfurovum sp. bin170]